MKECPVCLEEGGDEHCSCGRAYHAACICGLLINGYRCCLLCYVRFTPSFFLCGAKFAVEHEETPMNWINLATALTGAGRGHEALQTLTLVRPTCPLLQTCVLIETGRAFLQLGSPILAVRRLRLGIHLAKQTAARGLYVRALALLCSAHCLLGEHQMTREVAALALRHSRKMHYTVAMCIMRTLADSFQATGERTHHKEAMETLCKIVSLEVKDPQAKAAAEAELGIAEHGIEIDSTHRLRAALMVLRKRPHTITLSAARCLASQVKPAKRMRWKMRPEDVP